MLVLILIIIIYVQHIFSQSLGFQIRLAVCPHYPHKEIGSYQNRKLKKKSKALKGTDVLVSD